MDETPVHEALREAVVNSMVHTDYKVGGGIVIMRHDDRYQIENPGTLLVSQEQLRRGGVSECRNKSLQRMFVMIGVGEQAGSGFARIQEGWKDQHWRAPRLTEQHGPDRVRLEMPMISLMPRWAFDGLRAKIGTAFDGLPEGERIALGTAMIEQEVTNTRMQDLIADHPSDITKLLRGLVAKGFLETDNQRRWTRYRLPATIAARPDLLSALERKNSSPLASKGKESGPKGEESPSKGEESGPEGEEWQAIAASVAGKGKVSQGEMRNVILELCRGRTLTLGELARLLNRAPANLRNKTLTPMVREGLLRYRYPEAPNRPDQSYLTA